MGVSAPLCNYVDIDNFSILYSARAEQSSPNFSKCIPQNFCQISGHFSFKRGSSTTESIVHILPSFYRLRGRSRQNTFFQKYFFPRVAEFHSWSSLLDYGLLFGDILQHNFHFYINDSFLSKLTILTSFSQKKKKQQTIKLDQRGGGDLLFVTYIIRENTMQRKKCWDGFPSDPPFLNSPFTMSTTLVNFTIHKFFGDKFPKEQRNGT